MPSGTCSRLNIGLDTEYAREGDCNRYLSLQFFVLAGDRWCEVFRLLKGGRRLPLRHILFTVIQTALKAGIITRWPKEVVLACHNSRADLPAFSDFNKIKSEFDSARNTYVTLKKPWFVGMSVNGHNRLLRVTLLDTMLLCAQRTSLADIGERYGLQKYDPGYKNIPDPAGGPPRQERYIEHMDWLLEDDPDFFRDYAMRDAEISARFAADMVKLCEELGSSRPLPTLGVIAALHLQNLWKAEGIEPGSVLGYRRERSQKFDERRGRSRTVYPEKPHPVCEMYRGFAEAAYHGGRNECFHYGPTPLGQWFEYDIVSAYLTAMMAIRMPDYDRAFTTTDANDFTFDTLGFASVRFEFPLSTRYPCLPVDQDGHGLIYPLKGQTTVTAPEIDLALRMGAKIEILHGLVIPWMTDGIRPLAGS
jgi:hypothetical protein